MFYTIKYYHYTIIFAASLLVACGGSSSTPSTPSSGSTSSSGGTPTSGSTAVKTEKWLAVDLKYDTGKYPAGSKIPLVCIKGGDVGLGGPVDNCPVPHLHHEISIFDQSGVSGPFSDPDAPACGHGKIGLYAKSELYEEPVKEPELKKPLCPKLESAKPANEPLAINVTDPKSYSAIVLELFADDGTTETVDIKQHLNAGVNTLYPTADPKYTRIGLSAVYDKGYNSTAGVNQVKIEKWLFDPNTIQRVLYNLRNHGTSSSKPTTQLTVNLSDYTSGALYVGGRKTGTLSLTQGPNIFDVMLRATVAYALVFGYDTKWVNGAFMLPNTASTTIDANSSNMTEMKDSTLDDSSLSGVTDYLKTQIYAKGGGIFQPYYELPGASAGVRDFPTADSKAYKGLNMLKSSFSFTDPITSIKQSATYSYFFDMPGTYKPMHPTYLTQGEIITQDTATGFDITNNHAFMDPNIKAFMMSLDVKTMDMTSNTEYSWDLKLSTSYNILNKIIPVNYPQQVIDAAGDYGARSVPLLKAADMTKISLKGSNDVDAALGHEFNDDSDSLNNLKGTYQVRLNIDF